MLECFSKATNLQFMATKFPIRDELLTFGYIAQSQKLFPDKDNPWYNIPDLVTILILKYFGMYHILNLYIPSEIVIDVDAFKL